MLLLCCADLRSHCTEGAARGRVHNSLETLLTVAQALHFL